MGLLWVAVLTSMLMVAAVEGFAVCAARMRWGAGVERLAHTLSLRRERRRREFARTLEHPSSTALRAAAVDGQASFVGKRR